MDEAKTIALAMLGIVSVLAIIGLVLMFSTGSSTGAYAFSSDVGASHTGPGEGYGGDRRYGGLTNPCGDQPRGGASAAQVQAWIQCMQDYNSNRYGYN